jgi:predicted small metal-binding protein
MSVVAMGLFRKKEEGTVVVTKGPKMDGWLIECGPKCGFMARNHNKAELVEIAALHMRNSHDNPVPKRDLEAALKPTSWGG